MAGLLLAYFAAFYYGEAAGSLFEDGTLAAVAGIVLVFALVLVVFYLIGRMAQAFLNATPLGIVDTLFGGLLGVGKAVLVFGLLLILAQNEPLHSRIHGLVENSALAGPIQKSSLVLIDQILVIAPDVERFLDEAAIRLPGEHPPVVETLETGTGKFTEKIGEIVNESKKRLEAGK